MLPITLVSLNTYLVAKRFNKNRITFPEDRASLIRQYLHKDKKDLCFLQEVWGSGLPQLVHTGTNDDSSFSAPPGREPLLALMGGGYFGEAVSEVANTLYLHWMKTGGLYDFASDRIECYYRKKNTFTVSRSRSLKGIEATLWKIPQWGPERWLLVLNTHLDPWVETNRELQVQQIESFFEDTLQDLPTQNWSQTGVLVVGDFNIKAASEEYRRLVSKYDWKDYFQGVSQQTYASENSYVACPEDCGRIDYIFGIQRYGKYAFLPLECLSRSIDKQSRGEELSDHYPLRVELIPETTAP
jgi:hypothetical protein